MSIRLKRTRVLRRTLDVPRKDRTIRAIAASPVRGKSRTSQEFRNLLVGCSKTSSAPETEDMEGRVIPKANELGANYYKPPVAPEQEWMINNRKWINARMDEGCTIYNCGAALGRANYPDATSPYYQMELDQIARRGYPTLEIGGSR